MMMMVMMMMVMMMMTMTMMLISIMMMMMMVKYIIVGATVSHDAVLRIHLGFFPTKPDIRSYSDDADGDDDDGDAGGELKSLNCYH